MDPNGAVGVRRAPRVTVVRPGGTVVYRRAPSMGVVYRRPPVYRWTFKFKGNWRRPYGPGSSIKGFVTSQIGAKRLDLGMMELVDAPKSEKNKKI